MALHMELGKQQHNSRRILYARRALTRRPLGQYFVDLKEISTLYDMYLLIDPPRNLDGAADVMTHATHYIYVHLLSYFSV